MTTQEDEKTISQASPRQTINALTAAINRGDLAEMLSYFESDALLVVQTLAGQPGEVARGKDLIRDAYAGFVSLKPTLQRQTQQVVVAGDLALHFSRWTLAATSAEGKKIEAAGVSSDVLRKQADGRWLVFIYNPYGTSIVG